MAPETDNPMFAGQQPVPPATSTSYPKFVVDLDLPPRQRWAEVAKAYKPTAHRLLAAYKQGLEEEFGMFGWVTRLLIKAVYIPKEYEEELRGLSDATGLDYTTLLSLNVGYDFVTRCMSSVIRVGDKTYHLRNMDWDLPVLKEFTMELTYKKGGKDLFKVVGWLGFVGAMTAVSSAGYSVSLNFRKAGGGIVSHLLTGMTQKKELVTFKVRDLLVAQKPFDEFVQGLVGANFLAPCYLTVASADGGGVVVPRGKGADGLPLRRLPPLTKAGAAAPELPTNTLSNERYAALVQTNHDSWCQGRKDHKKWAEGDELLVNTEERSACAMESLASLPLKGDEDPEAIYKMLRDVLLKDPVYNSQTIYSLIMVPSDMHVVKVA